MIFEFWDALIFKFFSFYFASHNLNPACPPFVFFVFFVQSKTSMTEAFFAGVDPAVLPVVLRELDLQIEIFLELNKFDVFFAELKRKFFRECQMQKVEISSSEISSWSENINNYGNLFCCEQRSMQIARKSISELVARQIAEMQSNEQIQESDKDLDYNEIKILLKKRHWKSFFEFFTAFADNDKDTESRGFSDDVSVQNDRAKREKTKKRVIFSCQACKLDEESCPCNHCYGCGEPNPVDHRHEFCRMKCKRRMAYKSGLLLYSGTTGDDSTNRD